MSPVVFALEQATQSRPEANMLVDHTRFNWVPSGDVVKISSIFDRVAGSAATFSFRSYQLDFVRNGESRRECTVFGLGPKIFPFEARFAAALRDQAKAAKSAVLEKQLSDLLAFYDRLRSEINSPGVIDPRYPSVFVPSFEILPTTYANIESARTAVSMAYNKYSNAQVSAYAFDALVGKISKLYSCAYNKPKDALFNEYKRLGSDGGTQAGSRSDGVVVEFTLFPQTPARNIDSDAELDFSSVDSTYRNLILIQGRSGFEYFVRFAEPVKSYSFQLIRIASSDLSEIVPVSARKPVLFRPPPSLDGKPITQEKAIALIPSLPEGVYKIRLDAETKSRGTIRTFWQPQSLLGDDNDRLLDGVVVFVSTVKYASKDDYQRAIEPRVFELIYKEKGSRVLGLSKAAKDARKQLYDSFLAIEKGDADFVQYFLRLERVAKTQADVLEITMADNLDLKERTKAQIYRSVWLEKLLFYLGEEKRLVDKELAICSTSLMDKSLIDASTYFTFFKRYFGQGACSHDPLKKLEQLQFQKAFVDYMLAGLTTYAKDVQDSYAARKPISETLEQAITRLSSGFAGHLLKFQQSADAELKKIVKDRKGRYDNKGNIILTVSGTFRDGVKSEPARSVGVKISETTCNNVLGFLFTTAGDFEKSRAGIDVPTAIEYARGADGKVISYRYMSFDFNGYSILQQACLFYAQSAMALKLGKSPEIKARYPGVYTWTLQSSPNAYASEGKTTTDGGILTRLADAAKFLGENEAYLTFRNLDGQTDSTAVRSFDAYKCIAPYTSPSFVLTTAAFVGAGAATGGAGALALSTIGDAMLVHAAVQLATHEPESVSDVLCNGAGLAVGAFTSTAFAKTRLAVKKMRERPSEPQKKIARVLEERVKLEGNAPRTTSPRTIENGVFHSEQPALSGNAIKRAWGGPKCRSSCGILGTAGELQGSGRKDPLFDGGHSNVPPTINPVKPVEITSPRTVELPGGGQIRAHASDQILYLHRGEHPALIRFLKDGKLTDGGSLMDGETILLNSGDRVIIGNTAYEFSYAPTQTAPTRSGPQIFEFPAPAPQGSYEPLAPPSNVRRPLPGPPDLPERQAVVEPRSVPNVKPVGAQPGFRIEAQFGPPRPAVELGYGAPVSIAQGNVYAPNSLPIPGAGVVAGNLYVHSTGELFFKPFFGRGRKITITSLGGTAPRSLETAEELAALRKILHLPEGADLFIPLSKGYRVQMNVGPPNGPPVNIVVELGGIRQAAEAGSPRNWYYRFSDLPSTGGTSSGALQSAPVIPRARPTIRGFPG